MSRQLGIEVRVYVLTIVAASLYAWDIGFQVGAFRYVFFDKVFGVWVFVTACFFALLFLRTEHPVSPRDYVVMAFPTAYLLLVLAGAYVNHFWPTVVLVAAKIVVLLFCLPYSAVKLLRILRPDVVDILSMRFVGALAVTVAFFCVMGFVVGRNNDLFLTCEDFLLSGNYVPPDCRQAPTEGMEDSILNEKY